MRLISDDALATLTIWQEARNQTFIGMCAVGEVIRNRMARRYNSDGTVAGTVCRAWQFSGWNTQDPNRVPSLKLDDSDPLVQLCRKAWYTSQATTYAKGAVLYLNKSIADATWAKEENKVAVIEDHTFFVDK